MDGLGSVRLVVDGDTRQIVDTYRYAPFGSLLAGGTSDNSFKFTGQQQDASTGLYYLRARWYDPATGRFLTRDPVPGLAALPQTQHPYVYVGKNPVNLIDPAGLTGEVPINWLKSLAFLSKAWGDLSIFALPTTVPGLTAGVRSWVLLSVAADITGGMAGCGAFASSAFATTSASASYSTPVTSIFVSQLELASGLGETAGAAVESARTLQQGLAIATAASGRASTFLGGVISAIQLAEGTLEM
ncbi:MAG: RHS repeat-associated core domain-containing protein [Anaerolineae bacterium]|nr:RHS repeat-associated core domain-containing protein [Anaerolineae bacterium]MDH7474268.1 RHS repeat-associated core domain-containing protein [Anaerolineae bacterium]